MNLSLGGPFAQALNDAIDSVRAAGVVPVVAAGNKGQDVAGFSPASAKAAITVGAITQRNDSVATFSNFGSAVDILAGGDNVLSASNADNAATKVLSGTSMACPIVAGLAAYLMSTEGITDIDKVDARIKELAAATGARANNVPPNTTDLIANNGNK
jgi:subtilisin family serine protease